MNARQQLARLIPLVLLVLLACVGLRGGIGWNGPLSGPLHRYGAIVGIGLEVILGTLLVLTYYRERAAERGGQRALAAAGDDAGDLDIARTLRALLRLLLAVAMAGIAVALLVGLHLHAFSKPERTAASPVGSGQPTLKPATHPSAGGGTLDIPLRLILYALLIIVLLAALVLSIWWARRLSRSLLPPAAPARAAPEEELREAVASGRAAMTALDDARAAIIACYEAMEQRLAERGAARGVAGTPDELLRHVTEQEIITGTGAQRLTTLFYEARFSTHHLGPGIREAAIRALDDLAAELAGAEPDEVATGSQQ
ncbi:MAG TPA: DUF4129 domain-containing protein [Trebonia sp.]|nr:DUF4129 domain-containing protein [Trebonia sp.]